MESLMMDYVDELYLEALEKNYEQLREECRLLARLVSALLTRQKGYAIITDNELDNIDENGYLDITKDKHNGVYTLQYTPSIKGKING